jgi:hypothetical protein
MPWVTFGCRHILGVAVGIEVNIKDVNCFAQQSTQQEPNSRQGRATARECRQLEAPKPPRIKLKGSGLPLDYCLVPVKVPSPNCPSDTLPFIVLPSVLPQYFTARLPA